LTISRERSQGRDRASFAPFGPAAVQLCNLFQGDKSVGHIVREALALV
jgi:hypothetical protein